MAGWAKRRGIRCFKERAGLKSARPFLHIGLVGLVLHRLGGLDGLTGGTAWLERKNDAVLPVVRELVRCHIPVAAICNAVNFLAENGFLDQRRHTGNTLPFLKSQAPHYKGEAYFVEAEAVCDNGILTANGFGALELAKEILRLLKFRSEQELAEWYAWNKFGLYSPGHKGRTPSGL